MDLFEIILFIVSVFAGGIASITGFGIGSILTPLLVIQMETKTAIAVVSISHFFGTMIRCWTLRQHIDKKVLLHFGILSAMGGLIGALISSKTYTEPLTLIFGVILIFSGITGATGLNEKFKFSHKMAWMAGALSGFLGGLVGNQGGIRSAALLEFDVSPKAFVGTATAIGLIVDTTRLPVYFATESDKILAHWPYLLISTGGVLIGTQIGMSILKQIQIKTFKKIVSGFIFILGLFMFYQGLRSQ